MTDAFFAQANVMVVFRVVLCVMMSCSIRRVNALIRVGESGGGGGDMWTHKENRDVKQI